MIREYAIKSEAEWLEWRSRDVTASDVAAVFGLHPYKTTLELWAEKTGIDTGRRETSVMRRGRILEPAVRAAVEIERPEWRLEKVRTYYRDPKIRIGATPDFRIQGDRRGLGMLQAKTASPRAFKRYFEDDRPPFWITLQTITELMLTKSTWGVVGVLVVDAYREPDLRIYDIPRLRSAEKKIEDGVRAFWKDVDAGRQPTADYSRDAALMSALYTEEIPGTEIDLSGDNELPAMLEEHDRLVGELSTTLARISAIETELKSKMKTAELAFVGDHRVTWKVQRRRETYLPESQSRVLRIRKAKT